MNLFKGLKYGYWKFNQGNYHSPAHQPFRSGPATACGQSGLFCLLWACPPPNPRPLSSPESSHLPSEGPSEPCCLRCCSSSQRGRESRTQELLGISQVELLLSVATMIISSVLVLGPSLTSQKRKKERGKKGKKGRKRKESPEPSIQHRFLLCSIPDQRRGGGVVRG